MNDNLDNDLLQLFSDNNPELPEEPFRAELRLRVKKARNSQSRMYWILTALVLAGCAAVSNFVIDGVTLLCGELPRVLQSVGELLAKPASLAVASAVALISLPWIFRTDS